MNLDNKKTNFSGVKPFSTMKILSPLIYISPDKFFTS